MAEASRNELVASAAFGASGVSAQLRLSEATMAMVGVDVTAGTGTSPTLDVWLQGSDDGGTTWYDLPYDQQTTTSLSGAATDITAGTAKRNINGGSSAGSGASRHAAVYKHLPTDTVRLRWAIGGTTPSFTFSASIVSK